MKMSPTGHITRLLSRSRQPVLLIVGSLVLVACAKKMETYYPNGQLRESYYAKKGKEGTLIKHGRYITWDENGTQLSEGTLRNGEHMNGSFVTFHANGQKKTRYHYRDRKQEGPWQAWFDNGTQKEQGFYKNDLKDSLWTTWSRTGTVISRGTCRNGKRHGPWLHCELDDTTVLYFEEGTYEEGEREGTWTRWKSDQRRELIHEGTYEGGIKHGSWQEMTSCPDSTQDGILTGSYENGRREGTWREKYADTRKKKCSMSYQNGKLSGKYVTWDRDGSINEEGIYTEGVKDSVWMCFDRNENCYWVETYQDGKRINRSKLFY